MTMASSAQLGAGPGSIAVMSMEVDHVRLQIAEVEVDINDVKTRCRQVEDALKGNGNYLGLDNGSEVGRAELLMRLGALEKEKEQLREDKGQLRKKELHLMPIIQPAVAAPGEKIYHKPVAASTFMRTHSRMSYLL